MSAMKPGILRKQHLNASFGAANRSMGSPARAVHFQPPSNLGELLVQAANEKNSSSKTLEELDGHLTHLKNQRGQAMVLWLQTIQQHINALKPKLEYFVFALLKISWADQDRDVVDAYRSFLTNLVSAQGYYVKPVVLMLMSNFVGFEDSQSLDPNESLQSEQIDQLENLIFRNTHLALQSVLEVIPFDSNLAVRQYVKECLPYSLTLNPRSQRNYIMNLLALLKYLPSERRLIFQIIIGRLVELDAHLPHWDQDEDLFEVEENKGLRRSTAEVARDNLEAAITVVFLFIKKVAEEDADDLKALYFDLLNVFESHILPVYATSHVQFLMFYILSFRPAFVGNFLDYLWKLFINVNTPNIIRQSAVAYIASLISRATFIKLSVLLSCLEKICEWIHLYLRHHEPSSSTDGIKADLKAHGPFYGACQAAFYLFAFRHEEIVSSKKHLVFLRNLHFNSIVTSHLNPLRVCLPPVVKNFAEISRDYQLAYCDTIIQRNARVNLPVVGNLSNFSGVACDGAKPLLLDSFFPFDPYRLKTSSVFVESIYRKYQGNVDDEDDSDDGDIEVDGP